MNVLDAIRTEFVRYKELAERALAQVPDEQLAAEPPGGGNSIATICWHISGNLRSRFTDFLLSDGEKPWRQRDEEFEPRQVSRAALEQTWEQGWNVLLDTLGTLTDAQLGARVTIRGEPLTVLEALLRALAHVSSHAGQIVYAAKAMRGAAWSTLSIPRGQSARYVSARPEMGSRRPTDPDASR